MDEALLLWINQAWAHPALDVLFGWLSDQFTFAIPLLFVILAVMLRRYARRGLLLWLVLVLLVVAGDQLGNAIKDQLRQPRPCQTLAEQLRTTEGPMRPCEANTKGMPSNHALNFFAMAVFVSFYFRSRPWAVGLFGVSVLVAVSRLYLGKHFPSQVLAGAGIGLLLGYVVAWSSARLIPALRELRSTHPPEV